MELKQVLKKLIKGRRDLLIVILLAIVILPAIWPLFKPGFFLSDDGEWMIIRFSAFHQALTDGQFPVRWLARLNHEYGYPVANFLYPGFMYLAEFPKILGFGFVSSIKIVLGLSIVFSGIFSYLWLSKIFSRLPSSIGALFYVYAPYHLYDVYKRGSVGEVLALAVAPFILWQIERKSFFWSTAGIGFLILSHNTLALLFLPLIVLYLLLDVLILKDRRRLFYKYTSILVLGLGLSAFFWIPAIFNLGDTRFSQTVVSNFNEYFAHQDLIGLSTFAIFALLLTLFLSKKIEVKKHRLTLLMFVLGLISLFFASPLSSPFWEILPVSFVQFPFRFLSITILCASFLAACSLAVLPNKLKITGGSIILLFIFVSSKTFITPSQFFDRGEGFYATNMDTTTVRGEYMPRWVKVLPTDRPKQKVEIVKGEGEIENQFFNSKEMAFRTDLIDDSLLQVNTIYFPGWKVWIDNKAVVVNYNNERGVIQIPTTKGEHQILVKFGETPLRLFSDIISLLSLLTVASLLIKKRAFSK